MRWSRRRRPAARGSAAARRPGRSTPRRRVGHRAEPRRRTPPPPQPASPDARRRRRSSRLTSRAAILGLVVCAMVLALAYPLREYLAQRSTISHLEQQQSQMQHNVAALEHRRAQWHDPAFVKAQARRRLQYVMPGDVAYVVVGPKHPARDRSVAQSHAVTPPQSAKGSPWYSQLWTTVRAADRK